MRGLRVEAQVSERACVFQHGLLTFHWDWALALWFQHRSRVPVSRSNRPRLSLLERRTLFGNRPFTQLKQTEPKNLNSTLCPVGVRDKKFSHE